VVEILTVCCDVWPNYITFPDNAVIKNAKISASGKNRLISINRPAIKLALTNINTGAVDR